jgi:hypothetical protein
MSYRTFFHIVATLVMTSECHDLRGRLTHYCKVGRVLNDSALADCERLAEVVKDHLKLMAKDLLDASRFHPVLLAFSSDATPVLVSSEARASDQGSCLRRRGKILAKLLMQRGILKSIDGDDDMRMAVLMTDPLPLSCKVKPMEVQ